MYFLLSKNIWLEGNHTFDEAPPSCSQPKISAVAFSKKKMNFSEAGVGKRTGRKWWKRLNSWAGLFQQNATVPKETNQSTDATDVPSSTQTISVIKCLILVSLQQLKVKKVESQSKKKKSLDVRSWWRIKVCYGFSHLSMNGKLNVNKALTLCWRWALWKKKKTLQYAMAFA